MSEQDKMFFYNIIYSVIKRQDIIIEQLSALSKSYANEHNLATEESESEEYDVERFSD